MRLFNREKFPNADFRDKEEKTEQVSPREETEEDEKESY